MQKSNFIFLILFLLFALDIFLWHGIMFTSHVRPGDYFLDVGQGDSELVILPSGSKILIDGGPNTKVVGALEKILPAGDRYLDLVINSHPQLDHFAGLSAVLDSFSVGAFLWNGRNDSPNVAEWRALLDKVHAQNIPMVPLAQNDTIKVGDSSLTILSPNAALGESAELNDTGLVIRAITPTFGTLFTADIATNVEAYLVSSFSSPLRGEVSSQSSANSKGLSSLRADVLKLAHHGSKYSSSDAFLRAVNPKVIAIEVGASNTYGHPAKETLARIASDTTAQIFRTDQNGTIFVFAEDGKLKVTTEK